MSDLTFKMEIDEIEGNTEYWSYPKDKIRYFMNDKLHTFVDPNTVKVGDWVSFNQGELEKSGIVTNIRKSDFIYYDIGFNDSLKIEEVAHFQVFSHINSGSATV